VDELNALLGTCVARVEADGDAEMAERLRAVQGDLFALGAHLATPAPEDGGRANDHIPPLPGERVAEMERWIDEADELNPPLRHFILPGGTEAASRLHLARTVCRRAERRVITLARGAKVEPEVVIYLNRLSDLLFTLARSANRRAGTQDVPWVPNPR
jgi:cob(I)alamin adenosyltransferase